MTTARSINTKDDFSEFVDDVQRREGFTRPAAFGIGVATYWVDGDIEAAKQLDARFLAVNFGENYGTWAVLFDALGDGAATRELTDTDQLDAILSRFAPFAGESGHPNLAALRIVREVLNDSTDPTFGARRVQVPVVAAVPDLADPPSTISDAFLRLHLLSMRHVAPHGVNLDGIFAILNNVAWTSHGPIDPEAMNEVLAQRAVVHDVVSVHGVDKFPRMVDYVVPSGIRIADANRVRLGAHLASGTTVMQEGFCNFNAGTLGACMVEGRISAGVTVGAHTDLGGGCSIMGTLSGGGKEVISVGEQCLIGANAGIGVSLGDHCVIEAGLYLTAGTPVTLLADGKETQCKAKALSGSAGLLFYRHGTTGRVEAKPHDAAWAGLNSILHDNS